MYIFVMFQLYLLMMFGTRVAVTHDYYLYDTLYVLFSPKIPFPSYFDVHNFIQIWLILPSKIASTTKDTTSIAWTMLLSFKCTMRGVITSHVSNATLCKVMCLEAPKSMILLHMLQKCASLRIANAQTSLSFSFFCLFLLFVLRFVAKTRNVARFATVVIILHLGKEMSCHLCLVTTPWRHPHFGLLLLALQHQTCCLVIHRKFLHLHHLHGCDQVFKQCRQALE